MVKLVDIFTAAALCAMIIFASVFSVQTLVNSRLYRQSKTVSMLVQQEPVEFSELLENNARGISLFVKFAGALAAAYINFEFLPLNEASTFMVILESLPDDMEVSGFEYVGRDLQITGEAALESGPHDFVGALRQSEAFASVNYSCYEDVNGKTRFHVLCVSSPAAAAIL